MTTEELYEDRAHDLLATAFDGDVPMVDLVPGAVDGFRRHRRRTRVLGAAGGALALAGVIAAGTTVTFGGGASGGQSAAAGGGVDKCKVPDDVVKQAGWDAAMVRRVTENCETNIALIEHAIPGARVEPSTPKDIHLNVKDKTVAKTVVAGARFYPIIAYDITVNGRTTILSLFASDSGNVTKCRAFCMKDTTLSGGMRALEYSGPDAGVARNQIDDVLAFVKDKETLDASVTYPPGDPRVFDFDAFSHSADFVKIVTGSTDLLISGRNAVVLPR